MPERNSYERVREFHETFGHPVGKAPLTPTVDRMKLRLALILEEAAELTDAMGFDGELIRQATADVLEKGVVEHADLIEIADALGDIEYVVNGAALECGINLPQVVSEIHHSNMTKLGPDGKPIYRDDGKILKGEGYRPPNIAKALGI